MLVRLTVKSNLTASLLAALVRFQDEAHAALARLVDLVGAHCHARGLPRQILISRLHGSVGLLAHLLVDIFLAHLSAIIVIIAGRCDCSATLRLRLNTLLVLGRQHRVLLLAVSLGA